MKKLVGQLRRGLHLLRPEVASMVQVPAFEAAIQEAGDEEDAKAFLMIAALNGIALDPLSGKVPEAFYTNHRDVIGFHIRFDHWVNFIGLIELPAASGRAAQLIEAIKGNLENRIFKAAKMHRRLDQRRRRLHEQAHARAFQAWRTILDQCGGKLRTNEDMDRADEAYSRAMWTRMEIINTRIRKVANCACPAFQGGYTEAVGEFLYWHLPFRG